MSRRVALVSCASIPEPDVDEQLMLDLLRSANIDAEVVSWDDDSVDWSGFGLCVLRSTWNYHEQPERFLDWAEGVARVTALQNPVEVIRWNVHKGYLDKLAAEGIPVVPTEIVSKGRAASLQSVLDKQGWDDVVVKPCISAGSANTRRFARDQLDEGEAFLRELLGAKDVMIQPYLKSVETGGERAAVMIGGKLTHAIEKSPRFAADEEQVSSELPVSEAERGLLDRVMGNLPAEVLYARLDTMIDNEGEIVISEVEVIEPSLFLLQSEAAQDAFVDAIQSALNS